MNDINLYEKMPVEEKNFPIRLVYETLGRGPRPHWHEHLELIFVKKGNFGITSGGRYFDVAENELVIINCNEVHYFENRDSGRYYTVIINPSFFEDVDFKNVLLTPHIGADKFITDCVNEIFEEKEQQLPGYDMKIKSLTYGLMAHLLRHYTAEKLSESDAIARRKKITRITHILQYISLHYNISITTASLAREFNFSEHYFCHFFKENTGQSPMEYINGYRIQKAAVMLRNTDQSIADIASDAGFDDTNYFSRIFKKYMGLSPSAYKKQL